MVSPLIDETRRQKVVYRTIANRLDQAERELAEHRVNARENARERNQLPPDPLSEMLNPQNARAFSTPEIPSTRSRRYMGENSQQPPHQGMPQRSLSYSWLDEIDTGLSYSGLDEIDTSLSYSSLDEIDNDPIEKQIYGKAWGA